MSSSATFSGTLPPGHLPGSWAMELVRHCRGDPQRSQAAPRFGGLNTFHGINRKSCHCRSGRQPCWPRDGAKTRSRNKPTLERSIPPGPSSSQEKKRKKLLESFRRTLETVSGDFVHSTRDVASDVRLFLPRVYGTLRRNHCRF